MKIYSQADIIALRKRCGDTQEQFAQRLSATVSCVNRWEHGSHVPSRMACRLLEMVEDELRREGR